MSNLLISKILEYLKREEKQDEKSYYKIKYIIICNDIITIFFRLTQMRQQLSDMMNIVQR